MAKRPVTIAGAGPSGLSAAISLARAGREVTVYERAKTVGSKFVDGFQIIENYSSREDALQVLRRMNVEPDFVLHAGTEVDFYDAALRRYPARCREPFGYFVKRGPGLGTVDTGLLEQARAAGAEVIFDRAAQPDEVDIVATGPRAADGVAREIVFKTDQPDGFQTLLDPALTGVGFAYLFTIAGQATLGVALMGDFASLAAAVEQVTAKFQQLAPFQMREPVTKSTHVNFFIRAPQAAANGSPLAVGEAAGFQDFLWGIGIRRSITSGHLAARAILEGLDYRAATRRHVTRLMEASILNRIAFEWTARLGYRPFLSLAARFDFRRFGLLLTRPGPLRLAAAKVAKAVWKNRHGCKHGPDCTWCRSARNTK